MVEAVWHMALRYAYKYQKNQVHGTGEHAVIELNDGIMNRLEPSRGNRDDGLSDAAYHGADYSEYISVLLLKSVHVC